MPVSSGLLAAELHGPVFDLGRSAMSQQYKLSCKGHKIEQKVLRAMQGIPSLLLPLRLVRQTGLADGRAHIWWLWLPANILLVKLFINWRHDTFHVEEILHVTFVGLRYSMQAIVL